jgi:hypothetical protein
MKSYETLTEAVKDLKARGFDRDFNLNDTFLQCSTSGTQLSPSEFEITEVYRFEGNTDPGDELVLYAIQSATGLKGIFVNAYGPYANTISDEMIAKLKVHH